MSECVRRAWLVLDDGRSLPLEDTDAGYVCTELDLGWPEIREVVNNRPDADGIDDRTRYFGSRAVTANIAASASYGAVVDEVAASFAPYMLPSARPELHYVLERPGNPERVLHVRGSGYTWPINGTGRRDVHLAWIAADPIARDATAKTARAYAGSASPSGRSYNLTYDRIYPPGSGASTVAAVVAVGEVAVSPLLRVYGPATEPSVYSSASSASGAEVARYQILFKAGVVVDAGHYVEIDCAAHTATLDGDPTQPVLDRILWTDSQWLVFHPTPATNLLWMAGGSTASGITQVEAEWRDGWVT